MKTPAEQRESPLRRHLAAAAARLAELEPRAALAEAAAALRLARDANDPGAVVEALSTAALAHYYRGDYVATVATGLDACAATAEDDAPGAAAAMAGVALALTSVADFTRAGEAARRAILLATLGHDLAREASSWGVLGAALAEAGDMAGALDAFRRAARRYRQAGPAEAGRLKRTLFNAGVTLLRRGHALAQDPRAARRAVARAGSWFRLARAIAAASRQDDIHIDAALAECRLLLGHADEARELATRAAARLKPGDLPLVAAYLRFVRGEIARRQGRLAVAERHFRAGIRLQDNSHFDHRHADCRRALARLLVERGDARGAERLLVDASRGDAQRQARLATFRDEVAPLWGRFLKQARPVRQVVSA